ncbi:hypothetical protein [Serratia fonticola]|uniref:hypothetical protein n=1 Tax=Serratia fonticola TaxID=47917 RepID=UPI000FBC2399|nr:hypothetical protein [Serratia fonticola]NTY88867.1 hypothetical protein [Serratia fonticola]NTZ14542.1 hypothetical protein [Serratia fonticola]CAI1676103.1 Uncharacterised protein [Serratia fonticola]CAI1680909.1 Uncharacterised protein [Serratia fonticola]CAI1915160.1 Uncharacterised protein [Serratia fonticola]
MKRYALLLVLLSPYVQGQTLDANDPLRRVILDQMRANIGYPTDIQFVVKQLSVSGSQAYFCATAKTNDGSGSAKINGKTVVYDRELQMSAEGFWTTVSNFDSYVDSPAQAQCHSTIQDEPAASGCQNVGLYDAERKPLLDAVRRSYQGAIAQPRFVVSHLCTTGKMAYFCGRLEGEESQDRQGMNYYDAIMAKDAKAEWQALMVESKTVEKCNFSGPAAAITEQKLLAAVKQPLLSAVPQEIDDSFKIEMLTQFQRFQQAIETADMAYLKAHILFPLENVADTFLAGTPDEHQQSITSALFDHYAQQIRNGLKEIPLLGVNLTKKQVIDFRVNSLTPLEQARKYFPAEEDGQFYYHDGTKKVLIEGTCDSVGSGDFEDGTLAVFIGTGSNLLIPGLSEVCEGGMRVEFTLQQGTLMLTRIDFVG